MKKKTVRPATLRSFIETRSTFRLTCSVSEGHWEELNEEDGYDLIRFESLARQKGWAVVPLEVKTPEKTHQLLCPICRFNALSPEEQEEAMENLRRLPMRERMNAVGGLLKAFDLIQENATENREEDNE